MYSLADWLIGYAGLTNCSAVAALFAGFTKSMFDIFLRAVMLLADPFQEVGKRIRRFDEDNPVL
jgi:hypothetical protein